MVWHGLTFFESQSEPTFKDVSIFGGGIIDRIGNLLRMGRLKFFEMFRVNG